MTTPQTKPDQTPPKAKDAFWSNLCREIRKKPIQFLSFLTTLAGLIVVVIQVGNVKTQIKSLRESLDLQSYSAINSQVSEIDKVFIDHPDLRPYFYENQVWPRDVPTRSKIMSVAERKLDLFDFWFMSARHMDRKQYDMVSWKNYFVSSFRRSQVLCDVLRAEQDQYQDELRGIASKSGCVKIAPRNPEVLDKLGNYFPTRTNFGP